MNTRKKVINVTGDGRRPDQHPGLDTLKRLDLDVCVIVLNNSRSHGQELPGHYFEAIQSTVIGYTTRTSFSGKGILYQASRVQKREEYTSL